MELVQCLEYTSKIHYSYIHTSKIQIHTFFYILNILLKGGGGGGGGTMLFPAFRVVYIYIYAFSRCSTTEPQEHCVYTVKELDSVNQ